MGGPLLPTATMVVMMVVVMVVGAGVLGVGLRKRCTALTTARLRTTSAT